MPPLHEPARAAELFQAALAYACTGFSVIPVGLDKKPGCDWKPYQRWPAEPGLLRHWFGCKPGRRFPNIGLVCGRISGGLLVLDFDQDASLIYPAWCERVGSIGRQLPVVETGKGLHVYLRTAAPGGNRKLALDDAGRVRIETRGQGGYVLAPPSRHPSGKRYGWREGNHAVPLLTETELDQVLAAAVFFDARRPAADQGDGGQAAPRPACSGPDEAGRLQRYAAAVLAREAEALAATAAGGRNDALNRAAFLAGRYVGAGLLNRYEVESQLRTACSANGNGLIDDDGWSAYAATLQSGLQAGIGQRVDREALLARLNGRFED
jgi:hypothetical protein